MKKQCRYLDELKKFINLSEVDMNKLESNKYTIKHSLIPTEGKSINSNEKMDCTEIDDIINILNSNNIPAAVIGRIVNGNQRILHNKDEERFLTLPNQDEIFSCIKTAQ